MHKYIILLCLLIAFFGAADVYAQKAGIGAGRGTRETAPTNALVDSSATSGTDSLYIFEPAKSLLSAESLTRGSRSAYGPRVCISGNGFGLGFFYSYDLSEKTTIAADFVISGARNTAELEVQDGYYVYVPNKVNRVYMIPLMLSLNHLLFSESMSEHMRPFASVGAGMNYILAGPYDPYSNDFFRSMGSARTFVRAGAFVGLGATVRNSEKSTIVLDARYYYLPFGGDGIESIRYVPMKEFNGLFLSLSVGFR